VATCRGCRRNVVHPMQGSPPGRRTRWFESPEVRLMSGWAFDELGLRELHAKTDGENEASLRLPTRSGFRCIGSASKQRGALWRSA
jgi:RimJ/RimL family protein N-acetyltransferase